MNRDDFLERFLTHPILGDDDVSQIEMKSLRSCDRQTKLIIIMEELAELQQAVSKLARGEGDKGNLIEEMADVDICLDFLQEIIGISNNDRRSAKNVKLLREWERIIKERFGVDTKIDVPCQFEYFEYFEENERDSDE